MTLQTALPVRRRELLAFGTVAMATASLPAAAHAAAGIDVDGIIVDRRFPASHALRTPIGSWRHEIDGDVTALWYDRLDLAWRRPGTAIAGVTGEDALFVLEQLAWDRRRRVVLREAVADGLVRWTIAGKTA